VVIPAIEEQIRSDLDRLSAEQQRKAAEFVHSLVSTPPRVGSIEGLMDLSGSLDDRSAREMMEAIEDGCRRVDLGDVEGLRVEAW
jgi:hypothetical protein